MTASYTPASTTVVEGGEVTEAETPEPNTDLISQLEEGSWRVMKLQGWCTKCHKIRYVRVQAAPRNQIAMGVCRECEETRHG